LFPGYGRYKMGTGTKFDSKNPTSSSGRYPHRYSFTGGVGATHPIRRRIKEMKTRSVQITPGVSSTRGDFGRRSPWLGGLLVFGLGLLLTATPEPLFSQESATPQNLSSNMILGVRCVIGLDDIKPGATSTLTSSPTGLEFTTGKKKAAVTISSIQDVFTGRESRQDVSGMGGRWSKQPSLTGAAGS
jgi:hypothetical protein